MNVLSLCTGYGGLELALGHPPTWVAEYDKYASTVIAKNWPGVPNLGDITTIDWERFDPVDVLTAGYPCQPFSLAGRRKGSSDVRHLWPHIVGAIRLLRPGLVLLENVSGHLTLGFGAVIGDLATLGYDARWVCVRASDVGAPHQRLRLFIAAADASRGEFQRLGESGVLGSAEGEEHGEGRERQWDGDTVGDRGEEAADADEPRLEGPQPAGRRDMSPGSGESYWGPYEPAIRRWESVLRRVAPEPTDEQGRLNPVLVEWMMGLPEGWVTDTPSLSRSQQLKILGNGVVPQQAREAFRQLGILTGRITSFTLDSRISVERGLCG